MDIISAYREVGSYRGAAAISGTTAKTVKRVIVRHESGGAPPDRSGAGTQLRRGHRVGGGAGRKTLEGPDQCEASVAGRLQAAGYEGSARNFRRLVATRKALWRNDHHRGSAPGGVVTG